MKNMFSFDNLFVFDLANNHQGQINHGIAIINEISSIVNKHKVKSAIKFQFRELKTFIHPSHQKQTDQKHIIRFKETELKINDYQILFDEVKKNNLFTICTPFDEASVNYIEDMKFDLIKVASCSAQDWPLLEKIAASNLPIIFSTGGLSLSAIDDLVSFFNHRNCDFFYYALCITVSYT